jgi:hypothetical protein
MRVVTKLSLAAVVIGASFSLSAIAQANDSDHDYWRHERWDHRHYVQERPVVVRERPVVVERERPVIVQRERPVIVAPAPMYMAPPAPSGLNLNFNIPLN